MSHGRHAAPRTRGLAAQAARTAVVRTGAFGGALAVSWAVLSTLAGQGHLDAFAATDPGSAGGSATSEAAAALADPLTDKVERLSEKYQCSTSGLGEGVIPARTVVRVDGEVRLATFDEGWAIHLGDVPGTLVSVCAR